MARASAVCARMNPAGTIILGGGVTGLAAGYASGRPVFEAGARAGGMCCSYYVCPGDRTRLDSAPADGEAYRFDLGGGHWIFGGDPAVLGFIDNLTPCRRYVRASAVWFPEDKTYVPYPLQNHLRFLPKDMTRAVLREMATARARPYRTMEEWLLGSFGPTLCGHFFVPFHESYTAGLYRTIAPQDGFKSPVDLAAVIEGAFGEAGSGGYNATYLYPEEGLGALTARMALRCDLRCGKRAVNIDPQRKELHFDDGTSVAYDTLICTLPLDKTMSLAGFAVDERPDPCTSALVVNIGARKGAACPEDHWLYHPRSDSGFHRVGFYSNVDAFFLPRSARGGDRVSMYVERAYLGGATPSDEEVETYCQAVVRELTAWGFIETAEVIDPAWIDTAYTWSWPGSSWKQRALEMLQARDIYMVGRYGRWIFQGIADSIRDGFIAGASLG